MIVKANREHNDVQNGTIRFGTRRHELSAGAGRYCQAAVT